jgi:hypothetical protein
MLFMDLDHGAILRKGTGLDSPKIVRLVETQSYSELFRQEFNQSF